MSPPFSTVGSLVKTANVNDPLVFLPPIISVKAIFNLGRGIDNWKLFLLSHVDLSLVVLLQKISAALNMVSY